MWDIDLAGMSHSILLARRQGDEGTEANNLEISLFSIDEVVNATDNFSVMSKLGEGGFGSVYKVLVKLELLVEWVKYWIIDEEF